MREVGLGMINLNKLEFRQESYLGRREGVVFKVDWV